MKYADLHMHSSYSDGALTPEELIENAQIKKIKYISITDHDSIESQYVTKNKYDDLTIIPGVEFSAKYEELEIHILGYFVDINNNLLKITLDKVKKNRINRTKKIIQKLNHNDINISFDELLATDKTSIGRGNIACLMVKKGYAKNYKEAFNNYLAKGRLAYVEGEKLEVREVLKVIEESGGISVLAHPGKMCKDTKIEKIIKNFKVYGLKGLEVYHPSHTKEQIITFYNMSKKYKLLITGGSDYHGGYTNNTLGTYGIDEVLLNKLIKLRK